MELPKLPDIVLKQPAERQESAGEGRSLAQQQVSAAVESVYHAFTGALYLITQSCTGSGRKSDRDNDGGGSRAEASDIAGNAHSAFYTRRMRSTLLSAVNVKAGEASLGSRKMGDTIARQAGSGRRLSAPTARHYLVLESSSKGKSPKTGRWKSKIALRSIIVLSNQGSPSPGILIANADMDENWYGPRIDGPVGLEGAIAGC